MVSYFPGSSAGTESGNVYPLEESHGYHSASADPADCGANSFFQSWMTRVWVPANKEISRVGYYIFITGVLGAGGFNSWAVYSDDGQTLLGDSGDDDAIWTGAVGWREKALTATIPAQSSGRFVRVRNNVAGISDLQTAYCQAAGGEANSVVNSSGNRRSVYTNAEASWPATFNPATIGTNINYIPIVMLGD